MFSELTSIAARGPRTVAAQSESREVSIMKKAVARASALAALAVLALRPPTQAQTNS